MVTQSRLKIKTNIATNHGYTVKIGLINSFWAISYQRAIHFLTYYAYTNVLLSVKNAAESCRRIFRSTFVLECLRCKKGHHSDCVIAYSSIPETMTVVISTLAKWPPFSQTTFSNAFPWMKILSYCSNFIEICSQWSNNQYTSNGLDNGLVPNRRQALIWINGSLVYRRIYASLGLNELTTVYSAIRFTWIDCIETFT